MKLAFKALPIAALLLIGPAHAQLYKSVGPDGKVIYSDRPATSNSTPLSGRPASASSASELPYALAQAVRAHPVTLYTTSDCLPCDDGRALLKKRGVPFQEKTVSTNDDAVALKHVGGSSTLPFLTIGKQREEGFEPGSWNKNLTAAGYPAESQLPRNYRDSAPQAAAPRPQEAPARTASSNAATNTPNTPPSASSGATELPPATGNAPPGFRF